MYKMDLPVYEIKDIPYPLEQCGFVLALKKSFQEEVLKKCFSQRAELNIFQMEECFFYYLQYLHSPNKEDFYPWHEYHNLMKYLSEPCVLIMRGVAMGDVLCVEPIIRKFKKIGYRIFVVTERPEVFSYNHDITAVLNINVIPDFIEKRSLIIDLDETYENAPSKHIFDAYLKKVQKVLPDFTFDVSEKIPIYDKMLIHGHNNDVIKNICVNCEGSWPCRTYERTRMKRFVKYLRDEGYGIFEIGSDEHNYLGIGKKCYGMKLHDTIALMSTMDLYIGMDGGLMHFAQAIHLPMFIFFGCTCPNFRIHDWSITKVLWKNTDELSCAGCHHRRKAPRTFTECDRDKIYCMDWSVEEVILAFETKKFNDPPKLTDELYKPL